MERLTIDEIIEHCNRKTGRYEKAFSKDYWENKAKCDEFYEKEYWEHRQVSEYLEELKKYRQLEEQGLLLRLPIAVNDVVDKLFSHNELISLWLEVKEETTYHKRIWYGMAWDIPDELKGCKFVKIFGTIPESIAHADIINIEIVLSKEAEEALEKMKGE